MTPSAQIPGLCQIFYISRSVCAPVEVEQILTVSRRQNQLRGVTGLLLFSGGHFAQLLEGPAPALQSTMAAIEADPRHHLVTRLLEAPLAERRFKDWSMAFFEAAGADDLIQQLLAGPTVSPERGQRLVQGMLAPYLPMGPGTAEPG